MLVRPHMPPYCSCLPRNLCAPGRRAMLKIENAFAPTWPFTMRAAQFIRIFVENGVHSESITEALDVC